jgi:hypothetical protein
LFSQIEVHIDEDLKEINLEDYNKKCYSEIFKCSTYKTDSIKINKVLFRYAFGKLNKERRKELNELLSNKSSVKIDSNRTLIITYNDTLFGLYSRLAYRKKLLISQEKTNLERKNSGESPIKFINRKLTPKTYLKSIKKNEKKLKKCISKANEKYNTDVFFFYKNDKDYLKDIEFTNWIQDTGLIKDTFFKIANRNNFVILKPNGDYFLSEPRLSDNRLISLLKNNDWSQYKLDWENSIAANSKTGIGFFKREKTSLLTHCF